MCSFENYALVAGTFSASVVFFDSLQVRLRPGRVDGIGSVDGQNSVSHVVKEVWNEVDAVGGHILAPASWNSVCFAFMSVSVSQHRPRAILLRLLVPVQLLVLTSVQFLL